MRDLVEWNSRGETQETEREWKKKKTRMSFTAKERAALLRGAAVMGWTQFTFIITQLTLGYGGMTTHLINVPLLIRRACSRFSHWQLRDCFFLFCCCCLLKSYCTLQTRGLLLNACVESNETNGLNCVKCERFLFHYLELEGEVFGFVFRPNLHKCNATL